MGDRTRVAIFIAATLPLQFINLFPQDLSLTNTDIDSSVAEKTVGRFGNTFDFSMYPENSSHVSGITISLTSGIVSILQESERPSFIQILMGAKSALTTCEIFLVQL